MNTLVVVGSKLGFFLMMLLGIPLLIETEYLLSIWLNDIPEYTIVFCRLMIVNSLIDAFNFPLVNAIQASGKIMRFQLLVSSLVLMNLPISYVLYKASFSPESAMIVSIIISIICFIPRIYYAYREGKISYKYFFYGAIVRTIPIFFIVVIAIYLIASFFTPSFYRLLITVVSSIFLSAILIFFVGLIRNERIIVVSFLKRLKKKC